MVEVVPETSPPQKIRTWLESVKAGFGSRYEVMFQAMGIEDVDDVRAMSENRMIQLRMVLKQGGVKPVQLDRLVDAVSKVRGEKKRPQRPTRGRPKQRPQSATPRRKIIVPTQSPQQQRKQRPRSAPAARRVVDELLAGGPTPKKKGPRPWRPAAGGNLDALHEELRQKYKASPPLAMQRIDGSWTVKDETRQETWDRLTSKKTPRPQSASAVERKKSLRISRTSEGDSFPYSWGLDDDRRKIWDRLISSPRKNLEKPHKEEETGTQAPFVPPNKAYKTVAERNRLGETTATVPKAKPIFVQKVGEVSNSYPAEISWNWNIDDNRKDAWERILKNPRSRQTKEEPQTEGKKISIAEIQRQARDGEGLFKPVRVNGEHVEALKARQRSDLEEKQAKRFVYVAPPTPRRFPMDVLLKTWTLDQISKHVDREKRKSKSHIPPAEIPVVETTMACVTIQEPHPPRDDDAVTNNDTNNNNDDPGTPQQQDIAVVPCGASHT